MNKPLDKPGLNKPLRLIPIGNSTGVILPQEMLDRLRLGQGDSLVAVETSEGIELRRHDPEFEEQIAAAREVMRERRRVLRELAK